MQNIFSNNWRTYLFLMCAFFMTQSSQAQLLSEGFESGTFPPAGWASFDNGIGLGNSWTTNASSHSGATAAYIQFETLGGSISEDWLVTPAFTPTANEFQLSFYQKQTYTGAYNTIYEVRVSTTSQTNAASFTAIASYDETTFGTSYSQKIIDLSAYIGQSIYVAFVEVQDDGDDWYLDDMITLSGCSGAPAAANTVSAVINACPSSSFLLSLDATYTLSGITYQWQSSPDGLTWTDIAGAVSSTYSATQIDTTYYHCVITCANSAQSTISTSVQVDMNPFTACYCLPVHAGCGNGNITNVAFNTINNTTTCGPTDYTSYPVSTTVAQSVSYALSVTTDQSCIISVWFDWNQDGSFDASEWTQVTTASAVNVPTVVNISVPTTANIGTTAMRIRSRLQGNQNGSGDACTGFGSGESEDYLVEVIAGTNCAGVPTQSNTVVSDTSICAGLPFTASLDQAYNLVGITYQWQSSPDGLAWSDITGAINASYNGSQNTATYYQCVITCTNSAQSATSTAAFINVNNPLVCYCEPLYVNASCASGDYIDGVEFNTISNLTTGCAVTSANYSDYTSISTQISQAGTYSISITPAIAYAQSATVWIDFDHSGTFDATEQVFFAAASTSTMTGNITIPVTTMTGMTRMRVRGVYGSTTAQDPCASVGYGETEDYMVDILAATNCSGTPSLSNTIASDTSVCSNTTLDLSLDVNYTLSGITYQWQSSPDGQTWTNITGATSLTASVAQSAATYYQCIITCTNSGASTTSSAVLVNQNPWNICYCEPDYGNASCASGDYIDSLTFNTISNLATGCAVTGPNHSDYTALSTQVVQGGSYPIAVKGDGIYNQSATVWIDFDHSGSFDATEEVFFHTASTTMMTGTVSIPTTALTGNTRMRVRGVYAATTAQDPCALVNYGETEDYTVEILSPADGGLLSFNVPANACSFSAVETVTVTLTNIGQAPIQIGDASVELNVSGANAGVTTLTNTTVIPQGGSETLTFTADLSVVGTNVLMAMVTLNNDPNTANDMVMASNRSYGTSTTSQSIAICQGGSVVVGANTYTTSGTYTDVLTTGAGCDSVVTTVLAVNPLPVVHPTSTVSTCSCVTLDVPSTNVTYSWSTGATTPTISVCTGGTVTVEVTGANGCLNTQTTNVVVNQAPTATFTNTQVNNAALVNFASTTTGGTTPIVYAWNFGDPSSGANNTSALENPSHTYTTNGTYNVSLTISNMCDTVVITNLVTVSGVGIENNLLAGEFSIYPNPNNGTFSINSENLQAANLTIEMFTLQGQMVYNHTLSNVNGFTHKVETTTLAKGIYMVKVSDGTRNAYRKVVIE